MDHKEPENEVSDKWPKDNSVESGSFWGTIFSTIGLAIIGILEAIFS